MEKFVIHHGYDESVKQYTASVPELHLCEYGNTIEQAEASLKEAIILYTDVLPKGTDVMNLEAETVGD